jgi:hypothetical protein
MDREYTLSDHFSKFGWISQRSEVPALEFFFESKQLGDTKQSHNRLLCKDL